MVVMHIAQPVAIAIVSAIMTRSLMLGVWVRGVVGRCGRCCRCRMAVMIMVRHVSDVMMGCLSGVGNVNAGAGQVGNENRKTNDNSDRTACGASSHRSPYHFRHFRIRSIREWES